MDQNNDGKQLNQNNGGQTTDNQAKTADTQSMLPLPPAKDLPQEGGTCPPPPYRVPQTIADLDPALQALAFLGLEGPPYGNGSNGNGNVTRGYTGLNTDNSPTSLYFNPDDVNWSTYTSLSSKYPNAVAPLILTRSWVPWYDPKTGKQLGYIYKPDPIHLNNINDNEGDEEEMDDEVVMKTVMSVFD